MMYSTFKPEAGFIVLLQADDIIKVRNYLLNELGAIVNKNFEPQSVREQETREKKALDFSNILKNLPDHINEPSD